MTLVTLPYRTQLAAGQPEDIGMVLADLDAILAVVNGDLRNDNFSPSAGIALSKIAIGGTPDGTKFLGDNGTWMPPAGGGFTPIQDVLLAADGAIAFTAIPGTYRHLQLVMYLRSDRASTLDAVGIRFNNDSTANYDSYFIQANGPTPTMTGTESFAGTSASNGDCAGNTATANLFSAHVITIPHYANTVNHKTFEGMNGIKIGTATGNIRAEQSLGAWRSAAAITQINVIPTAGGANWKAGSRATLYGL